MTEKQNKTIRWGIIGCGDVTEVKSGPAYQQTQGFELAAVMRRDVAKAEDYALRHGVPKFYANADELINDPDIDAIYIATPPDAHEYYALRVAQAGKPCCIEKPLAPTHAESQSITQTFAKLNIPLFVAYYRRNLPRFVKVHTWLQEQQIGEIRHISWHFCAPPSPTDLSGNYNWRTDPAVAPGGYFDDLASHGLDLFTFLLGDIAQVSGTSTNQQGLYGAKDAIAASWLHKSGVTGTGSWNFGTATSADKVIIYGSRGEIAFSVFENNPIQIRGHALTETLRIEHPNPIQKQHVECMRDQLLHGTALHPSTGETATHTSWVMDQILGQ